MDEKMVIVINEGSLSQIVLDLAPSEQPKIAPYIKIMAQGEAHIKNLTGPRSGIVDQIKTVNYATPDPVNTTLHSWLRPMNKEKCP